MLENHTKTGLPFKQVSEAARERETFKYYPHLYAAPSIIGNKFPPARDLKTSADSILTGLAQLGAYQTNTQRAFISLFDTTHQFIIAEAIPHTPLTSRLPSKDCPSPLSLCGFAIPRRHGTCEYVLHMRGDGKFLAGSRQLPLLEVPNIAEDDRFTYRDYRQFGEEGQFYAAVPIRTRRGVNIGSFCVFSAREPEGWGERSKGCLVEISRAIMAHLEANRASISYRRTERMNRGLGSFVEGNSTLSGWQSGSNPEAFNDDANLEGALDPTQQNLLDKGLVDDKDDKPTYRASTKEEIVNAARGSRFTSENSNQVFTLDTPTTVKATNKECVNDMSANDMNKFVFSKAANIIREACEVAGCLFVDVKTGSYQARDGLKVSDENDTEASNSQAPSGGSGDEAPVVSDGAMPDLMSSLLGFSTATASSINGVDLPDEEGRIPAQFLAKLLRRYPNGKIFNFDSDGEPQSSDLSEGDVLRAPTEELSSVQTHESASNTVPTTARRRRANRVISRAKETAVLQEIFESARCIAFIPVWNSKTERWMAGGFVYTRTPARIFSVEGELSYLKAFGTLIAAEIQSLEVRQADKAKSDILGSLSHELRSPLHGVILSTELLNDTDLDVLQGNIAYTIETCSRTLLDTIDHLLDYSKINSFSSGGAKSTGASPTQRRIDRARSNTLNRKALSSNIRLDGIVEEVVESVFAGFSFQRMSIKQASRQGQALTNAAPHRYMDLAQAMEYLRPNLKGEGNDGTRSGNVSVYVHIEHGCEWMFNLQVGAIRRIVMNIFGNSLKYTESGSIQIMLSQEAPNERYRGASRLVKLRVQDTGKGIGVDYLHHKLFKPFAQEDELAQGTGLGLSIVKKIVSQLGGDISIRSQVGIGTNIIVTLPLELSVSQTDDLREDDDQFLDHSRELEGLRVRLTGFSSQRSNSNIVDDRSLLSSICRDSLGLGLVSENGDDHFTPDIVLSSEEGLSDDFETAIKMSKMPNVVVCKSSLTAYWRRSQLSFDKDKNVVEYISQPVGPRKLAKSLQLAYQRWTGLSREVLLPSRPSLSGRPWSSQGIQLRAEARIVLTPPLDQVVNSLGVSGFSKVSSEIATAQTGGLVGKDALAEVPNPSAPPPQTSTEKGHKQSKFLLVDDNNINLKVLSAYMKKLDRAYQTAMNGREALDAYLKNPDHFVCIVMDISMPIMDGFEATRQIRAHERKIQIHAVPIIALTGLASDSAYEQASASGVDIFLTKPTNWKTLNEVLESMNIK